MSLVLNMCIYVGHLLEMQRTSGSILPLWIKIDKLIFIHIFFIVIFLCFIVGDSLLSM